MDILVKLFIALLLLAVLIGGVIKWYQLVIEGAYFENASFFGSAMVTLLPAGGAVLLIWLLLKTFRQHKL